MMVGLAVEPGVLLCLVIGCFPLGKRQIFPVYMDIVQLSEGGFHRCIAPLKPASEQIARHGLRQDGDLQNLEHDYDPNTPREDTNATED